VVNTEPGVIKDLKEQVARVLDEIDSDLHRQGLFTLQEWQNEERTLGVERADFERRKESIASRKVAVIDGQVFLEPQNEAEVFACFVRLMALRPGLFPFELLDYNTNRGIDILARNKTETPIADCQYWYVEMKYLLRRQFNHAFSNLRWVVCWDFASDVKDGTAMQSIVEGEDRELRFHKQDGKRFYYLETPTTAVRISVIRLREFIEEHFGATFRNQQ